MSSFLVSSHGASGGVAVVPFVDFSVKDRGKRGTRLCLRLGALPGVRMWLFMLLLGCGLKELK